METVEKTRILVGLNVDHFSAEIIDKSKHDDGQNYFIAVSTKKAKELVGQEIENEFDQAAVSAEVEKGVRVFIEWLKSGKVEMRMYTEGPIHAKVYIMRKDPEKVPDMYGSVITGSSNFSKSGLISNLEFNVELKDPSDVKFALEKFEQLWSKGVDIRDSYIEAVETKTWMRDDITPYQLYLKTLYEFFGEEINADKETLQDLFPEGFMRLQYQVDAVIQAKKKLDAYNGVFISDVVGLGKTYICAMLANTFNRNTYKLFICPPVLVEYWQEVLQEFGVSRCDVVSLGKLDHVIAKGAGKYSYVFVDEAHRFRNSVTDAFTQLHQICHGKKVVLISATPINNYTSDIENQLYLFQSKQNGTINGVKNLEGFFRDLNAKLSKLKKGTDVYMKQLRANSEIIRDKLLREVMIRRTRSEIQQYYADDMQKQGLSFPKVGSPEKIIYEFDAATDESFSFTMDLIKKFSYARYMPLTYLKNQDKYASMLIAQKNMGGFMKGVLIKRLESSFHAFRMTLSRFVESYEKFIQMYKSGKVYISKKVDVYDLLDSGDDDKLLSYIEQNDVMCFDSADFKPQFMGDLEADLGLLNTMKNLWAFVHDDPKLDAFKHELQTNREMRGKKIIVFTESKETADYLCSSLKDIYGSRVISFSGQSSKALKAEIEDSFNPKFADKDNDKYDMLITTDVLSEGVNLHRSNVVVNYDLPWNPTRIMQRVGRINRVGTAHSRIYVFNFFPTAQSEKHVPLEERILEKLQAFHDTLGEDIKYLSDDEQISPKKLFTELNKNLDEDEDSTNPELAYLGIIRNVRDNDPDLFKQIKGLPKKAKAGKYSQSVEVPSTVSFIRKGGLKTFFISDNQSTKQLTFMEAIKLIEASPEDHKASVDHDYYDQLKSNSSGFDNMIFEDEMVSIEKPKIIGNDAKCLKLLKGLRNVPTMTDTQTENIDILINRISDGEIPAKILKDMLKCQNTAKEPHALYFEIMKLVPETYFEESNKGKSMIEGEKQVILSAYLKAGDTK
ncbi:MAG: phospholipase D-like domain-containing protein [Clostridia bacterium]|nr:phospholipase D-like domain-containing protein [Clostridia bacterium]